MKDKGYYVGCVTEIKLNPEVYNAEDLQAYLISEYPGLRVKVSNDPEVEKFMVLRAHVPDQHDLIEGYIDPETNKKIPTSSEPLSREMWYKITALIDIASKSES
tara:strand:- start:288 stop:599 length:312 start_codon:yes stop_codon:yes gene_type:complete